MGKKYHILVVDDQEVGRNAMEELLFRPEYELFFATDGEDALLKVEKTNPDVILMDAMMPKMDGFEACRRLKTNPVLNHIPILMVTALDSKEDLVKGFEAGADDFLTKPVKGIELRARVKSMLRIKTQFDELENALKMQESLANMIVHDISPKPAVLDTKSTNSKKIEVR